MENEKTEREGDNMTVGGREIVLGVRAYLLGAELNLILHTALGAQSTARNVL